MQRRSLQWQRIHLITVVDSLDKNIGAACSVDGAAVRNVFQTCVERGRLAIKSAVASDRQTVLDAVDSIQSGPQDTIVLYYSGHGFYDEDGHRLYFSSTRSTLSRLELRQHLVAKQARLHVMLTDCCNNYFPSEGLALRYRAVDPNFKPVTTPLFETLFFRSRGIADIMSSGEDEMSLIRSITEGSVFTIHLVEFLQINADKTHNWSDLFSAVAQKTEKESSTVYGKQDESRRLLKKADGTVVVQKKHTPVHFGLPD